MNMLQLALLVGKRQAIVGLVVENAFDAPDADGYIADTAGAVRGAHAVHVVAWVDNAWVPRSAPRASGGYFIVKSSWGRTYGDGGYAYVPVEWLRRNMLDIILI